MVKRFVVASVLTFLSACWSLAQAQDQWPTKPVRIIVNGAAGGASDVVGRIFSDRLTKVFGQPFILDFKPGANGIIGAEAAAQAPHDGYTLLLTYSAAHVVNPALYPKLSYDPLRDFTAIAQVGAGGNLLVVPANSSINNLDDFIAFAKSKPADELSYGSWGLGSGGHLSMEAITQKAGLQIKHIPYKASGPMLIDLMGGVLDVAWSPVATGLPLVASNKIKAIAVSGPYHVPQLPNVKTLTEQGVAFDVTAWYAFVAPARTPKPIVSRLNAEINSVLKSAEAAQSLATLGFSELPIKTPEEFNETIKADLAVWGDIVRKGNIRIE